MSDVVDRLLDRIIWFGLWLRFMALRLTGSVYRIELSSADHFVVGDYVRIGHVDDERFVTVIWKRGNSIWIRPDNELDSH